MRHESCRLYRGRPLRRPRLCDSFSRHASATSRTSHHPLNTTCPALDRPHPDRRRPRSCRCRRGKLSPSRVHRVTPRASSTRTFRSATSTRSRDRASAGRGGACWCDEGFWPVHECRVKSRHARVCDARYLSSPDPMASPFSPTPALLTAGRTLHLVSLHSPYTGLAVTAFSGRAL